MGGTWILLRRFLYSPPGIEPPFLGRPFHYLLFIYLFILFSLALQSSAGYGLVHEVSWSHLITHNDAPQSIGLLRTSNQLVAETSTWQHTTHTPDKHPCPRWDLNPDRSRRDLRLGPRGHWDRQSPNYTDGICWLYKSSEIVFKIESILSK
jgi:hypothetical protein